MNVYDTSTLRSGLERPANISERQDVFLLTAFATALQQQLNHPLGHRDDSVFPVLGLLDREHPMFKVNIVPPQPLELRPTQSGVDGDDGTTGMSGC